MKPFDCDQSDFDTRGTWCKRQCEKFDAEKRFSNDLADRIITLKEENRNLSTLATRLTKENSDLARRVTRLTKENSALENEVDAYRKVRL